MRHLAKDTFTGSERAIAASIADLWSELFDDPSLIVGPDDNFFALGGSSLLALRLLAGLRERFGVGVDLLTLAETATVQGLVSAMVQRGAVAPFDGEDEGEIA